VANTPAFAAQPSEADCPRWLKVQPKTGRQTEQSGGVEELKLPLVEHLDAILTSVGSNEQPGRFWSGEFFRQGDIDLPKLRRGAFGDLGGAFIINPAAKRLKALDRRMAVKLGTAQPVIAKPSQAVTIQHGWQAFIDFCGRSPVMGGVSSGTLKR
jgi:hypothetical protein